MRTDAVTEWEGMKAERVRQRSMGRGRMCARAKNVKGGGRVTGEFDEK